MLGKGSTGGCAIRIRSRMSAVVHVKRPQIFALLHWREIEECWLTLSHRGGETVICFMLLFEIDWPPPPPQPLASHNPRVA